MKTGSSVDRELRFRAWDGREMFLPTQITFGECGWSVDEGRGVSIPAQPHISLMQGTGLRDKAGVMIFEGDIVRICESVPRGDGSYDDGLSVTVFDQELLAFRFKGDCNESLGEWRAEFAIAYDLEIVGNVFETPDLVEGCNA